MLRGSIFSIDNIAGLTQEMGMAAFSIPRIRQVLSLFQSAGVDTSTDAGRAAERHRRIALSALASALARAISISTALISVPLTLHYLGVERYGMWMTMSTFAALLGFADFGIGNGVLTAVSRASGREDLTTIRAYVSSAFVLLSAVAIVVLCLLAIVYTRVEWFRVFNVVTPRARSEATPAITVFIVCFALSLPLGIVQRVQLGLQMGFVASLWQCLASLAGLCGVLLAIHFEAGLPWLVAAFSGAPVMVAGLNSLIFFTRARPEFAPNRAWATRTHGSELAHIGFLFFILQAVAAVAYGSDSIVVAQTLGATEVAHYAIPDRLFAMSSMIVGFAVAPLWPAFGEALARGDHGWARRTLIRATLLGGGTAGAINLAFVFAAPMLLYLWVGNAIQAPFMLLLGLGLWRTIEATFNATSMFLNSLQAIRFQIAIAVTTAVAAVCLKIALLPRVGIAAVPWSTLTAFLLFAGIPALIFLRTRVGGPVAATRGD